jgi:hypothetical protein
MNRDGHDNVKFFIGEEVEHTPALGERTLFVVGIQSVTDIQAQVTQNNCTHIYFGANQSFPKLKTNDKEWIKWENMIMPFLDSAYTCTLDIDVTCAEGLLEGGLIERHNFIPMISVKLPYIKQLGYNATLKLDDKDFKATNPGVWCHNIHDLQDRSVFTDWSKYTKDETL